MESLQTLIAPYIEYLNANPLLRAGIIVLFFIALAWLVDALLMGAIIYAVKKLRNIQDAPLLQLARRPIFLSWVIVGLTIALSYLGLKEHWQTISASLFITLALVVWTVFAVKLVRALLLRMAASPTRYLWLHHQTLPLFENLAYITIIALAVYYIFSAWHVDMTAWLASAGIVGIAVGFAAKDTLANLFSGVFIMADAPYKIGDFVVLDSGERGEVTKIGLRSTRILTRDDIEVTIPNSVMGNTKIINESGGPHEKSRLRVKVGVAYGSDIDRVREILLAVAAAEEQVCEDPEPRVRLRQFGGSSLDFELLCWINQPVLQGRVLDRLNCAVYKRFREEGVEIPYAKQDLYIKELPRGWGNDQA